MCNVSYVLSVQIVQYDSLRSPYDTLHGSIFMNERNESRSLFKGLPTHILEQHPNFVPFDVLCKQGFSIFSTYVFEYIQCAGVAIPELLNRRHP